MKPKSPGSPDAASDQSAGSPSEVADPCPRPPRQPELDDCCRSGCMPCVFDLYDAAMERYEIALAAWRGRHPDAA